jgi:hypothetical protein
VDESLGPLGARVVGRDVGVVVRRSVVVIVVAAE